MLSFNFAYPSWFMSISLMIEMSFFACFSFLSVVRDSLPLDL